VTSFALGDLEALCEISHKRKTQTIPQWTQDAMSTHSQEYISAAENNDDDLPVETDPNTNRDGSGDDASVTHRRIKSGPGRQEDIMQSSSEDLFLKLAQDANPPRGLSRSSSRSDRKVHGSTVY
jgi:hypothetical protein